MTARKAKTRRLVLVLVLVLVLGLAMGSDAMLRQTRCGPQESVFDDAMYWSRLPYLRQSRGDRARERWRRKGSDGRRRAPLAWTVVVGKRPLWLLGSSEDAIWRRCLVREESLESVPLALALSGRWAGGRALERAPARDWQEALTQRARRPLGLSGYRCKFTHRILESRRGAALGVSKMDSSVDSMHEICNPIRKPANHAAHGRPNFFSWRNCTYQELRGLLSVTLRAKKKREGWRPADGQSAPRAAGREEHS